MTAILELKQKIKNLYGRFEIYLLPIIKFALAFVYFIWINESMGYMDRLDNIFILLVLALICSILPTSVIVFIGFILMIMHAYALSIETAGFLLVLILFFEIFCLRFSAGQNLVLTLTPISFGISMPVLLPIGSGLLGSPLSAIPAGVGVILFYCIRCIKANAEVLSNAAVQSIDKLTLLIDGLVQNWAMWIILIAFVVVILLVNLIRTRSFDYAWRVAIIIGGVTYVLVLLGGSFFFAVEVRLAILLGYTVVAVLVGLLLEFFVFGGDYSRTERLQYEDDEYYYYVKAVPKASVSTSERSIKKITAKEDEEEDVRTEYLAKMKSRKSQKNTAKKSNEFEEDMRDVNFEKKLEESLSDL